MPQIGELTECANDAGVSPAAAVSQVTAPAFERRVFPILWPRFYAPRGSEIDRLADNNARQGKRTLDVETEKGYTTLAVELDGNTILSVTCLKKAAVRLMREAAW
jgi:hypothetical protein